MAICIPVPWVGGAGGEQQCDSPCWPQATLCWPQCHSAAGHIRQVAGVQCCPCLVAWLVADESSRWSVWEYMQISLSSCHLRLRESPGHWTLDKQNGERFHAGSNFVTTHEKLRFGSIELLKFSNKGETLLQWWCSIMEHLKHTPFFSS